jgi:hypothetical protein
MRQPPPEGNPESQSFFKNLEPRQLNNPLFSETSVSGSRCAAGGELLRKP